MSLRPIVFTIAASLLPAAAARAQSIQPASSVQNTEAMAQIDHPPPLGPEIVTDSDKAFGLRGLFSIECETFRNDE